MPVEQQFEKNAKLWEDWCESKWYVSDFSIRLDHESYRILAGLGKEAVPLVFKRWALSKDESPKAIRRTPPWWFLLERLTGKKLVSDKEKLDGLPEKLRNLFKAEDIDAPDLQIKRWLAWWEQEGKKAYSPRK